jgi:1-acyl-sn-glycerol-3-phosphate acyltransferase
MVFLDTQEPASTRPFLRWAQRLKDLLITLLLWAYFTLGFVVFFSPFYLIAFFIAKDRSAVFQRLNSLFYRIFFTICRVTIPRQKWYINEDVHTIRGAIILSNHVSYLDSIFLISLYPRHTTIAKASLFDIPIFGRMIALAGYIPSSGHGRYADLLLNSFDTMKAHLADGGNIIVFPEGTRSRTGQVGALHKGIFKIAKYCNAPIHVLSIQNTDKLFEPGKFFFNTCLDNQIKVTLIKQMTPDYGAEDFSIKDLMADVRQLFENKVD